VISLLKKKQTAVKEHASSLPPFFLYDNNTHHKKLDLFSTAINRINATSIAPCHHDKAREPDA
jgi:hypothetical protein